MKFVFKAKNKNGEVRDGVVDAVSVEAAAAVLQKNELFPIHIAPEAETQPLSRLFLKYYERVTAKELVVFFRQLAILIGARVPIVSSLAAINEQTYNAYFRRVIKDVISDIEDGMAFSDSLAKHKDVFSVLSLSIIKAGETSGNLKKSVEYVADNIEKNYTLVNRVRSAMIYPAIVMIVFFIIGFLVISFIIPKLTAVIKELNADVPWYTSVVINTGDFMAAYWWAVAVVILGFAGTGLYYVKTDDGQKEWDEIKIKAPVIGRIFQGVYIARFAENLAVLLAGGIPILRALTVSSSVINNSVYEKLVLRAAEEVKTGGNISTVFKRSSLFPPMVSHMIKIGEESGQIDAVLLHIAKFYEEETERNTKNLSTLIEPILMIFIGIAVGFMSIAVLMPIYNIAGQIK